MGNGRPVPGRAQFPWGFSGLRPPGERQVTLANKCLTATLLASEAVASRGGVCILEHPADPGSEPNASIWATAEVMEMERRLSAARRHADQCM